MAIEASTASNRGWAWLQARASSRAIDLSRPLTRAATIGRATEASYPTEAIAKPIDQREATRYQAEAKAQSASASGAEGLILLLQSMLAMQGSTNARPGCCRCS